MQLQVSLTLFYYLFYHQSINVNKIIIMNLANTYITLIFVALFSQNVKL